MLFVGQGVIFRYPEEFCPDLFGFGSFFHGFIVQDVTIGGTFPVPAGAVHHVVPVTDGPLEVQVRKYVFLARVVLSRALFRCMDFALQGRVKALSVQSVKDFRIQSGHLHDGGVDVGEIHQGIAHTTSADGATGHYQGYADAQFGAGALPVGQGGIIASKNQNGILPEAFLLQRSHQFVQVVFHPFQQGKEAGAGALTRPVRIRSPQEGIVGKDHGVVKEEWPGAFT